MKKRIILKAGADQHELAYLVAHLRHWTKEWKRTYGAVNRGNMQRWEKAVDDYLLKNSINVLHNDTDILHEPDNGQVSSTEAGTDAGGNHR